MQTNAAKRSQFRPSASFLATPRYEIAVFVVVVLGLLAHCWWTLDQVELSAPATVVALLGDRIILFISAALLLSLGLALHRRQAIPVWGAACIGGLCGAMFFFTWIGLDLLDPTHIQWLLRSDWAEHYSAWAMYRTAPWTWPLGRIQTLWYPVGTTIVYTDVLPLLAFVFKPFAAVLPASFQYIGLWLLVSCLLQGIFAALLVRRLRPSATAVLAGSILFLLVPIFLGRFVHDTLTAQWLLLAGLWLYFRREPPQQLLRDAWPWWLLATIAALVHPYLSAMFLAITVTYWFRRSWVEHACSHRQTVAAVAVAIGLTLLAWWVSGAFMIGYRDGGGGQPFGKYSFNLLGFLIPQGFSTIVPDIPLADPAQWEGQSYLGLGMIALLCLLGIRELVRKEFFRWPRQHWPLLLMAIAMAAFAASTSLTMGTWKLTNIEVNSPLLATFRSSGRFIWVPYYLILLGAVGATLRRFPALATTLLAVVAVSGGWEFSQMHLRFAQLRTGTGWESPTQRLTDPGWSDLVHGRHHLTMFPPLACGNQAGPYLPFELLAAEHGMTFNSGYLARWDLRATERYCAQLTSASDAHHFSSDDVYVVDSSWAPKLGGIPKPECRKMDSYNVCVFNSAKPTQAQNTWRGLPVGVQSPRTDLLSSRDDH